MIYKLISGGSKPHIRLSNAAGEKKHQKVRKLFPIRVVVVNRRKNINVR